MSWTSFAAGVAAGWLAMFLVAAVRVWRRDRRIQLGEDAKAQVGETVVAFTESPSGGRKHVATK